MTGKMIEKAFDPTKLPGDTYVTASDTEAYPLLKAMAIMGDAKLLGVSYEPDGREIVSFKVGGRIKEAAKPAHGAQSALAQKCYSRLSGLAGKVVARTGPEQRRRQGH